MKVSEIFKGIQGEGLYQGFPALFVRTSGCTRQCSFCDTEYHKKGKKITHDKLVEKIKKEYPDIVIFTGGEPLLQLDAILQIIISLNSGFKFHLETNGDLIKSIDDLKTIMNAFEYIVISPKSLEVAKRVDILIEHVISETFAYPYPLKPLIDIKVVTDLQKTNMDLVPYATTLMPLTTYKEKEDDKIRQRVWHYCIDHKLHFSARLHVLLYGNKKGI